MYTYVYKFSRTTRASAQGPVCTVKIPTENGRPIERQSITHALSHILAQRCTGQTHVYLWNGKYNFRKQ